MFINKKLISMEASKSIISAMTKSCFADEIGERYGEIEYKSDKVLQRWRGSSGNVLLSHLLLSFLSE